MQDLLNSVGQQIGITIESLQNTDQLVHKQGPPAVGLRRHHRYAGPPGPGSAHPDGQPGLSPPLRGALEEILDQPCRAPAAGRHCPFTRGGVETVFQTREAHDGRGSERQGEHFPGPLLPHCRRTGRSGQHRAQRQGHHRPEAGGAADPADGEISRRGTAGRRASPTKSTTPWGSFSATRICSRINWQGFPSRQDLTTIEKHAVNCQRIVSDLLEFARGQETSWRLAPLNRTIEEVVRMVEHQFRRQQVRHSNWISNRTLPLLKIDANKMKQVYLNLLMNARQAIKDRGEIRVEHAVSPTRRHCTDHLSGTTACGIPPEIMDRIFDPFFSTKKTGEGTGLGLSVSLRDRQGPWRRHPGGQASRADGPGSPSSCPWTRGVRIMPCGNDS